MTTTSHRARVAVVGGSIAGCAAAMAAHRAGHEVTVYERSDGDLAERGFGITLSSTVHDELTAAGYLGADSPALSIRTRLWMTRETGGDGWRELWRQPVPLVTCDWGLLWRSLRAGVPDSIYRSARHVTDVRRAEDGHAVVSVEGLGELDYDLVIGADGYRSIVRAAVASHSTPRYAGYVAFRGTTPLSRLSDDPRLTDLLADTAPTVMYDGGHLIVYPIPGGEGRRVNWVLYSRPPRDIGLDPRRGSFAPGAVVDDLVEWGRSLADERLPERIARIIARTSDDALGLQPIFDLTLDSNARMPFLLIGDASTITRPHNGSGAVKALQEALCLERTLRSASSTADAVAAFDAERNPAGNQLVELGRRIGRDQVEATPDWSRMDAEAMGRHVAATWSGQHHYLFFDSRA